MGGAPGRTFTWLPVEDLQICWSYLAEDPVLKGCHRSKELVWIDLASDYEAEVVRAIKCPMVVSDLRERGDGGGVQRRTSILTFWLEQLVRRFFSRPPVSD